jgi:hypothetical protein
MKVSRKLQETHRPKLASGGSLLAFTETNPCPLKRETPESDKNLSWDWPEWALELGGPFELRWLGRLDGQWFLSSSLSCLKQRYELEAL